MTAVPSTIWRTLAGRGGGKQLPQGLDAVWDTAAGAIKRLVPRTAIAMRDAGRVLRLEKQYLEYSDARLREEALDLRAAYRRFRDKPSDRIRAFALIREVAHRQVGLRAFRVQVAGAIAMDHGCIAEMATGEGKTLTAVFPAILAGWRGKGCHVMTANEYLASRDTDLMRPVYQFCGLTSATVTPDMPPPARREAYQADITYLTNKEAAADFLRDRLALGRTRNLPAALLAKITDGEGTGTDRLVQRGLHYAILDEADSLLIDEAVTPLIISGQAPNEEQVQAYEQASRIAGQLREGKDFRLNARHREVTFSPEGRRRIQSLTEPLGGLWRGQRRSEELVDQALTARHFYQRDKQYVIDEEKVVIVDEFTGRLMPDREWRDGLHQAVSAKEGVEVQPPKATYARISFQRFFRLYDRMCGMTGTAAESRREFWQMYHMPVAVIPTNRRCRRTVRRDRIYASVEAKWNAVVERITELHQRSQPVLVGTRSVRASERLSELLTEAGLDHQVLNAVRHREEAQIVAQAGQPGRITVATNMAGRGTDIKLGSGVAESGGLHVLATERHEARRIDRQLIGRCARQGEPGSAEFYVSLEDELVERHASGLSKTLRGRYRNRTRPLHAPLASMAFAKAQRRAQRLSLRQRKGVLKTDDWLDEYLGFAGSER